MADRIVAAILGILLASCTSVYVQTGGGTIERSTDIERSLGRARGATPPAKEPTPPVEEKR